MMKKIDFAHKFWAGLKLHFQRKFNRAIYCKVFIPSFDSFKRYIDKVIKPYLIIYLYFLQRNILIQSYESRDRRP